MAVREKHLTSIGMKTNKKGQVWSGCRVSTSQITHQSNCFIYLSVLLGSSSRSFNMSGNDTTLHWYTREHLYML